MGVRVNVTVVDACGVLAAFCACPAHRCIQWKLPLTKTTPQPVSVWLRASGLRHCSSHPSAMRESMVRRPRFVAFGGGPAVIENGQRIGGIGVFGSTEEQDEAIAGTGTCLISD